MAFFTRDRQEVGYLWPTVLALLVHAVVVLLSVINLERQESEPLSSSIVNATLISTETTTDQAQQAKDNQASMNAPPALPVQAQEQEQEQEESAPPLRALEETVIEQTEALATQRENQALEQARAEAEAQARRRAEEAAQQALEAAEREAERAEQQAEEQRRRDEEEARQAQQAEEQRQREEEAARQAQEAAEQQRREEELARQAQQAEEQRRREEEEAAAAERQRQLARQAEAAAEARQAEQAANHFIDLVRLAVEQAWLVPGGASDTMSATIQVRLGPSGEVLNTAVSISSGDNAFDRSALQAVEHAAPFTELRELSAAQQRSLRQFNLRFTPGNIR